LLRKKRIKAGPKEYAFYAISFIRISLAREEDVTEPSGKNPVSMHRLRIEVVSRDWVAFVSGTPELI
jgi:hypothetical protein